MKTKNAHYSPFEDERPRPATVEAVREAADECTLDPRATPRSNQARLLFALYYCVGLPFPYGWREACVAELSSRGIPATTLSIDLLHTAMLTDAVLDFEGWPGIDRLLVRDLHARLAPPAHATVARSAKPPEKIQPRTTNPFDEADVERVLAAVGPGRPSVEVGRAMIACGFTGRRNLPLAREVCRRLGVDLSDSTITNGMARPSVD
jgi:hypothetical protein